jgi:LCP family protein required for cell wall assembly
LTAEHDNEYRPRRQRRQRKKDPIRTVFFALLGIVVVAAIIGGGYIFNLANSFNSKSQTIESAFPTNRATKDPNDKSVNILLMGSDSRNTSGENLTEVSDGSRSDTMMLMHIPENRENVYVMSIMRDTWVDIPGQGEHKINAAMAFGGVPLVVETIEGMFETRVDHVAIIDFAGFKELTDALGGVEINNPAAFSANGSTGEHFPAGTQTLDGESALSFVRERKAFSDGDYQRVRNQQLFVKALLSEFLTAETLTNPIRINEVVDEFSPFVSVDNDLNAMTAGSLGVSLRDVRSNDVQMFTLPTLGTGTSADGQSIVVPDEAAIAEIAEALQSDSLGEYLSTADLE